VLNSVKGKVLLSYYPHPLLEELYPKDRWHIVEIPVYKRSSGKGAGNVKPKATELVLLNYMPPDRLL